LLVLGFGFFPNGVLKMNKATAEAWLSRLMDQPITVSESGQEIKNAAR
jgi:NADH-quinone oxidoreductase subunit M